MNSIWQDTEKPIRFGALEGDLRCDVLVIGGGLSGLLCAYKLKKAGVHCVLVEAARILSGITKNTTAKITSQHGLIYDQTIRRFGEEAARRYYTAQEAALSEYRRLCGEIACDFVEQDAFVYALDDRDKLEREVAALQKLGAPVSFVERLPLPFSVVGAVRLPHQAQFHPLKFAYSLAKELPIYENTKVVSLRPQEALTERGRITAEKIVVATHFPFLNKHGAYFLKLYQHRSYVLALEKAPAFDGMYVDASEKGLSFRHHNGRLLLGGGSHRTGKKGGGWQELAAFAARYYPTAREVARWATQDCMSLDGLPYIGLYAQSTPNLYVATGYNKWGMTSSMVAASLLCDLILEKETEYAALFAPSRSVFHPQLAINAAESLCGLLTPTRPRCPHMGCALKYNREEHSWDCSCHGSRFTESGDLLDNPATGDKKGL